MCASYNFISVQSAYRCHYSTETALLQTMDSVFWSSDRGQPSLLVSLDMSAAFDTIDHSTLLNTLSVGFEVSGSVLTWLQSYLTDRYQCVRLGQASSSHTLCHTGVPQGSVLGPILFSCYISPISFIANTFGISIQQYADNTQLYVLLTPTDMHLRQSLLSVLCTVGFVTMAWLSIALNLNRFWLALANMHSPSYRITYNSWHSRSIFRHHQKAWSYIRPKLDHLKQACFLTIPQYSFLHSCAPSH